MKEIEAERSVVIDALQTIFGAVCDDVDGVGTQVCQLLGFHIAPDLLDRIEIRGISWQTLEAEPVALTGDPFRHASSAMGRQPIPDQQHRTLLMLVQECQEFNQCFVVVGARTQFEHKVRMAAIRFIGKGHQPATAACN